MFKFLKKNKLPSNAPSFLIIGAQKAGTTTLFDILNKLEIFEGSEIKEIHYFDQDKNFFKGNEWYFSFFEKFRNTKKIYFEATPAYLYYKKAPQRIYDTLGKTKFIILLRNPVDRAYSQWNMFRKFNSNRKVAKHIHDTFGKDGNEENKEFINSLLFAEDYPTFDVCISEEIKMYNNNNQLEEPSFIRRGLYYDQIKRYLKYYSIEDFLFLDMEDLTNNPKSILEKVYKFLNIEEKINIEMNEVSNKGEYLNQIDPDKEKIFKILKSFYEPHNEKLFKLIGKRYQW